MEAPSISKLGFYSLGLVAANKDLSSKIVEITPVEDFPMLNGEITDNAADYKTKTQDANGSKSDVSVKTTATIKAEWLPINQSNRRTAPDVRRGEQVVLYKFADTDKYYWNTMFDDVKLRRLETVIYTFSNNSKEGVENSSDSTYFLEVSTHKKLMHIHTSKNDGEPFTYDVQINAKDGRIVITDDDENSIMLDSKNRRIVMENGDGSIVDIDRTNIKMKCSDDFSIDAKNVTIKAASATTVTSTTNTINGPTTNTDTLTVGDRLSIEAGMTVSNGGGGQSTITGDFKVVGTVAVEGEFTATHVTSVNAITAPNV